ncbi:prion-like-(Q/N-rich) domain-bearing protein 25 [Cotesia typhae]|uniref:prion-like-(Q/N-rich) domain-bearing protein 25 n=1 Tax=Cotesia typhae TaxID=2053667 RepID=UPI003D68B70E
MYILYTLALLGKSCENDYDCEDFEHMQCSTTLGIHCKVDSDCEDPGHIRCNIDKICGCQPDHRVENNAICEPLLHGFCETNQLCKFENSECIDNMCKCKSGFIALTPTKCVKSLLGECCNSRDDCLNIGNATCSIFNRCICRKNNIAVNRATCMPILGGKCYSHKDCFVNNSKCIDHTCQCRPRYNYLTNQMCIITTLGTVCKVASDCGDDYRFECSKDNVCACKENFEISNNSTCLPKLGQACRDSEKCFPEKTVCADNKCQCKLGYRSTRNGTCIDSMLGKSCEFDVDCEDISHLMCSDSKVCICQSYHVIQISSCFSLLYRSCDNDISCTVNNSICIDNLCQCRDGYIADSPSMCLLSPLGQNCTSDFDCDNLNAECSNAGICVCNENFVMKNKSRCEPLLGGHCYNNESCKIDNSACIESKCQCNPGYMNKDKYKCLPSSLGKFCQDSFDCDSIWHMKCSSDNKCICKDHHSTVNNALCAPLLGAICMSQDSCALNNSICVDHECQCRPFFERVSKDYCMPTKLGNHCKNDSDCGRTGHKKCSDNHKCVCAENHLMINMATCLPLLDGFCTNANPCFVGNSVCLNNVCKCQAGYIALSHKQCIERIFN